MTDMATSGDDRPATAPRSSEELARATRDVQGPVVLFDGVCNLCNGWVSFVLDHERPPAPDAAPIRFASLQSPTGRALMEHHGLEPGSLDSVVLVDGGRAWTRSDAVVRLLPRLRAPWSWGAVLRVVPRVLRDLGYKLVARFRYRLFGRTETCRVPTPQTRARFLDL